jgi:hypothetical protein
MATPAGLAAAITASRKGLKVALIERTLHIGGLPANGLGATDIHTKELASGFFKEFVDSVLSRYQKKYSKESQQVKDCNRGFHFEPRVAEHVLETILEKEKNIELFLEYQFDALQPNVKWENCLPRSMLIHHTRKTKRQYWLHGKIFIDASYEGDLGAAFGCRFRTYREGKNEFGEAMAGKIYKIWATDSLEAGSTGEADSAIQAYNFRICLSKDPKNKRPIKKPENYTREEFVSLVGDIQNGIVSGFFPSNGRTAGVVNPVKLPNLKFDANNHHRALISTDLPEENWPYPTATWAWRDSFALRLRDYNLGLLYFAQNDSLIPGSFRLSALEYGLPKDEYKDNQHFPRQLYVREGRRIEGRYLFTAQDALPEEKGKRPPVHKESIIASHYAIDSHAMRKREAGKRSLDGFISYHTQPFTVPFGVMVPVEIDNILTPVPVSASHVGYGCLGMEPCWMGLGQAAGMAAFVALSQKRTVHALNVNSLQDFLIQDKVNLIYVKDVLPGHPDFDWVQKVALQGWLPDFEARLENQLSKEDIEFLSLKSGFTISEINSMAPFKNRKEALKLLFAKYQEEWNRKK